MLEVHHHALRLHADPSRVVVRPFHIAWAGNGGAPSRTERLVGEVLAMTTTETRRQLAAGAQGFRGTPLADAAGVHDPL